MPFTKVFVGNLSFKTKAEELAAEFSIAGRVVSANIITRGPRSLGYGFVEMESEEEAQKAVTLLNKKSVDQREINVELAKPRNENENRPQGERRSFRGRRGGRGYRGRPRGPPLGDKNINNQGGNNNNQQGGNVSNNNNAQNNPGSPQQGGNLRPYKRRFRGGIIHDGGGAHPKNNQGGQGTPPRERRRRYVNRSRDARDLSNRILSTTTLFVANLPFAMEDDALYKLFKDIKVSKAHVVKNRNGRSKGFGFVEFENENDQKAALVASDKLVVDNRELIVKVALTAPEHPKETAANKEASSTGSPAGVPSATTAAVVASSSKDALPTSKTDEKSS